MALDPANTERELRVFLVAGEHSGDALGAKLIAALRDLHTGPVNVAGVGGPLMQAQGLTSIFPLSDVAVMGVGAILVRLPRLVRRVHQTVAAALTWRADVVVIIDSPEFTHPIARRIRRRRPDLPIVDYVSPSVWAWRPGRARRMRHYVDHVLALLPFEPEAHARLGGPPCTYVGHPLVERMGWIAALDPAPLAARLALDPTRPVLVMLPGSRRSEVGRLLDRFRATIELLAHDPHPPQIIIPTVDHVHDLIAESVQSWPMAVHLVVDETDKWRAFKLARAALAASGTVTLELALAGTPMVVAYVVEAMMAPVLRRMITASTIILPNLVLERNIFREFVQQDCTPFRLAAALRDVMGETATRTDQLAALAEVPGRMRLETGTPSEEAASVVLKISGRVLADG